MWSESEKKFFRSLSTPEKIQNYLDLLEYNPEDAALSPRYVILSGDGHCFEGGLLAAAALEFHGYPPLMVDLVAHRDDHHVIVVYKTKTGWGSIAKSNTTLLRGRTPIYKNIRELVMSYFDLYFNLEGERSLYAYSDPINLNRLNKWNWRISDENLAPMGMELSDFPHHEILSKNALLKLPKVHPSLMEAGFLGSKF